MKDKQVKDLLKEAGLPVIGERTFLISRHERYDCFRVRMSAANEVYRWVILYNANLDKAENNRSSLKELRSNLSKWENEMKTKKKKPVVDDSKTYQVLRTTHDYSSCLTPRRKSTNLILICSLRQPGLGRDRLNLSPVLLRRPMM